MLAKGNNPCVSYEDWWSQAETLFFPVLKDVDDGHRWFLFSDRGMEGAYALTRSGTVDLKVLLGYMGIDADEFAVEPYYTLSVPPRMRLALNAPLGTASQCQDAIFEAMLQSIVRFPWDGGLWCVPPERPFSLRITIDKISENGTHTYVYQWFEFGGDLMDSDGLVLSYVNDDRFPEPAIPFRAYHGIEAKIYQCAVESDGRVHGLVKLMEDRIEKLFAGATTWTCACCGVEHSFQE